jgi:uncharacterized protein (TIGR03492 family)
MKLLVLSNGHGEDIIAVGILEHLQAVTNNLELQALPIVGEGYAYRQLKIPIIGQVKQMPSGGFIYMDGDRLWEDLRGGLIQLTIAQLKIVRQWGKQGGLILAVGDIVPLLFAWLSRANYAFVGTAKSEYYLRDETAWLPRTSWLERCFGSVYQPWDRWLMNCDRAKAIFPRDSLTAETLKRLGIPACDLGNPMMDGLLGSKDAEGQKRRLAESSVRRGDSLSILLLPGSRMPEALRNWQQIVTAVAEIIKTLDQYKLKFYAAIAPALDLKLFQDALLTSGWQVIIPEEKNSLVLINGDRSSLYLTQNAYGECLQASDIAIAMAGTATEQFVGLGKPVITMPGNGPQFTWAFAEAQSRLLGSSIILVDNPQQIATAIASLITDSEKLQAIAINGKRRMGNPGAAQRIAIHLQKTLLVN